MDSQNLRLKRIAPIPAMMEPLPNYEEVLPSLSQEQLNTLMGLTDSCCKAMEDYFNFVRETCVNV